MGDKFTLRPPASADAPEKIHGKISFEHILKTSPAGLNYQGNGGDNAVSVLVRFLGSTSITVLKDHALYEAIENIKEDLDQIELPDGRILERFRY